MEFTNWRKIVEGILTEFEGCEYCTNCIPLRGGYRDCKIDYNCNNYEHFCIDMDRVKKEFYYDRLQ